MTKTISEFISTFKFNNNVPDTDEVILVFNLMTEDQLDILYSEISDYISALKTAMEEKELYLPQVEVASYYGAYLWEVEPDYEYLELENNRSKAQEILNILSLLCLKNTNSPTIL